MSDRVNIYVLARELAWIVTSWVWTEEEKSESKSSNLRDWSNLMFYRLGLFFSKEWNGSVPVSARIILQTRLNSYFYEPSLSSAQLSWTRLIWSLDVPSSLSSFWIYFFCLKIVLYFQWRIYVVQLGFNVPIWFSNCTIYVIFFILYNYFLRNLYLNLIKV
jgi:hypothetical protein